jgi:hypothetical protein
MTIRSTICRECGADGDFYFKSVDANGGYGPQLLPLGWFSRPKFRLRVCGQCGLADWFVQGPDLPRVREKFQRKQSALGLDD